MDTVEKQLEIADTGLAIAETVFKLAKSLPFICGAAEACESVIKVRGNFLFFFFLIHYFPPSTKSFLAVYL